MFKNALLYRLEARDGSAAWPEAALEERLQATRFLPCGASQAESWGWVAPRGDAQAPLAERVAGQWMLELCRESKAVPGGVVRDELDRRLDALEAQTGHRPRGKVARELKESIVHELLPRAFPRRQRTRLWLDLEHGLLWVGTASVKTADTVVSRLLEALGAGWALRAIAPALAPAAAMADWLSSQEAPPGFSIDRDCELKQPDNEKAAVRYARHPLDIDEIAAHIQQGKRPTRLALTWAGRVSFVLSEALSLQKIQLLDGVLAARGDDDAGFDADVALFTGELRRLWPDLMDALGGEWVDASPTASVAAAAEPLPA